MPKGVHANHPRADRQHRWTDARMISGDGYAKVRVGISHPLADPNGYAYEHIVVWVSSGRRKPISGQILHHVNGVKTDNRIENLEVMTRAEHNRHHLADRQRLANGRLGKRTAGDLLGAVQHREFPKVSKS